MLVPVVVTEFAEGYEVIPVILLRLILKYWHDVVNLGAWGDSPMLLAVLAQWVDLSVTLGEFVPTPAVVIA